MKNARGGEIDDVDLIRDDETLYVYTEILTKDRVVTENVAIFDKPEVIKPPKPPSTYRKSHAYGTQQSIARGYSFNSLSLDGNRKSLEYVEHFFFFCRFINQFAGLQRTFHGRHQRHHLLIVQ